MKRFLIGVCAVVAVTVASAENSCIISGDTRRTAAASAWSAAGSLDASGTSWGLPGDFDSVCRTDGWGNPMNVNSRPPAGMLMILR